MNGAVAKRLNLLRWKAVSGDEQQEAPRHPAAVEPPSLIACLTGAIRVLNDAKTRPEPRRQKQA
jgi:hypothetical protein